MKISYFIITEFNKISLRAVKLHFTDSCMTEFIFTWSYKRYSSILDESASRAFELMPVLDYHSLLNHVAMNVVITKRVVLKYADPIINLKYKTWRLSQSEWENNLFVLKIRVGRCNGYIRFLEIFYFQRNQWIMI